MKGACIMKTVRCFERPYRLLLQDRNNRSKKPAYAGGELLRNIEVVPELNSVTNQNIELNSLHTDELAR